ncbi:nuclear transport factor 2 family protein [Chitinophagaceae bacterium LWZ2-11]
MKHILIILFMALTVNSFAQTKEQEVLKNVKELNEAVFITKDAAALEKLLDDKVTYGHSSGKVEEKSVMIRNAVSSTMTYPDFRIDSISVVVENNTAVVRHLIRSKTLDKGVDGTLNLGILLVFVNEKGTWKLIARQAVKA